MQKCSKCGQHKPADAFYGNGDPLIPFDNHWWSRNCKQCMAAAAKANKARKKADQEFDKVGLSFDY